ncbi:MAG: carboxypeptidase regulatory-like domain-containing protein [Planctomycetota bacterium]
MQFSKLLYFACLLALAAGCSSNLRTYPVKGKVVFANGRNVVVGTVEFQSVAHRINARGQIQPDGTFELTTYKDGDGAIAGEHKCVVLQMVIGENMHGHRPSEVGVVDPKFASYLTSGLSFTIDPDKENDIVVTVRGIEKQPAPGEGHTHD